MGGTVCEWGSAGDGQPTSAKGRAVEYPRKPRLVRTVPSRRRSEALVGADGKAGGTRSSMRITFDHGLRCDSQGIGSSRFAKAYGGRRTGGGNAFGLQWMGARRCCGSCCRFRGSRPQHERKLLVALHALHASG